jgi:gentisate 1,2-dioxygenase
MSSLETFNDELQRTSLQGHWKLELPKNLEPGPRLQPMHVRWSQLREYLMRSTDLISVDDAGRRSIELINPGISGGPRWTTHTLQLAFQVVLPGEIATAHRHTMAAIRFVVEGGGTFTTVEGDSFLMEPGDLILTPGWTWHDHINESDQPIIWIDGLDVPFVFALNAAFIEEYPEPQQPVNRVVRSGADGSQWYFKWQDAERELQRSGTFEYRHPDGRPTLPSMLCSLHRLGAGVSAPVVRQTAVGIYHVVRGRGRTTVGDTAFEWDQGDSLVVPNWTWFQHRATDGDAVLFRMSDQPLLEPFGLYREESQSPR